MGYAKVAVTVASVDQSKSLRERYGSNIIILMVHTSGLTEKEAKIAFETSDIITACASKWLRTMTKNNALLQVGEKVSIYAASQTGERLLRTRMAELKIAEAKGLSRDSPEPLI